MEFGILGPLLVGREGEAVTLGGRRNTQLLSLFLLRANEVVSADRVVEDLWAGAAPANPRKAVQVYVSRLRKTLGVEGIRRAPRRCCAMRWRCGAGPRSPMSCMSRSLRRRRLDWRSCAFPALRRRSTRI